MLSNLSQSTLQETKKLISQAALQWISENEKINEHFSEPYQHEAREVMTTKLMQIHDKIFWNRGCQFLSFPFPCRPSLEHLERLGHVQKET